MRRRSVLAASILASLLLAAAFALAAVAVTNTSDASRDAKRLAQRTRALAQQIQQERERSIRDNCAAVNERHDNTIATLARLYAQAVRGASPGLRKQLRQSRASTVLLIEALAPRRDCDAVVRSSVGSGRTP